MCLVINPKWVFQRLWIYTKWILSAQNSQNQRKAMSYNCEINYARNVHVQYENDAVSRFFWNASLSKQTLKDIYDIIHYLFSNFLILQRLLVGALLIMWWVLRMLPRGGTVVCLFVLIFLIVALLYPKRAQNWSIGSWIVPVFPLLWMAAPYRYWNYSFS